jgi:hypothetical protein
MLGAMVTWMSEVGVAVLDREGAHPHHGWAKLVVACVATAVVDIPGLDWLATALYTHQ